MTDNPNQPTLFDLPPEQPKRAPSLESPKPTAKFIVVYRKIKNKKAQMTRSSGKPIATIDAPRKS